MLQSQVLLQFFSDLHFFARHIYMGMLDVKSSGCKDNPFKTSPYVGVWHRFV
jgi:hypothetical protein